MDWKELETKYEKEGTKVKGWKQFLKPNWRKFILPFLSVLFFIFMVWYMIDPTLAFLFENETVEIIIVYFFQFPAWLFFTNIADYGIYFPVVNFIIWYLLSCLIIWIYEKVKKK